MQTELGCPGDKGTGLPAESVENLSRDCLLPHWVFLSPRGVPSSIIVLLLVFSPSHSVLSTRAAPPLERQRLLAPPPRCAPPPPLVEGCFREVVLADDIGTECHELFWSKVASKGLYLSTLSSPTCHLDVNAPGNHGNPRWKAAEASAFWVPEQAHVTDAAVRPAPPTPDTNQNHLGRDAVRNELDFVKPPRVQALTVTTAGVPRLCSYRVFRLQACK